MTSKPCAFPGCDRPARAHRTLCGGHGKQLALGKELTPLRVNKPRVRPCVECGAVVPIKAHDLCTACYQRARRQATACSVDGCTHQARTGGMCARHHNLAVAGLPLDTVDTPECSLPDCHRPRRNNSLCSRHDQQRAVAAGKGIAWVPDANVRKPKTPKPPKHAKAPRPPKSKLPKGWNDPLPPKKHPIPPGAKLAEVPMTPPTPQWMLDAAIATMARHGAGDLAWMLGPNKQETAA